MGHESPLYIEHFGGGHTARRFFSTKTTKPPKGGLVADYLFFQFSDNQQYENEM